MYVTTYKADGTITSIGKVNDSFPVDREHPPDGLLYTDEIPDGRGIILQYRIHPKAITRERRKLKAYKRLLDKGIVTMEEIDGYFRSWLSGNYKYMSRDQIYKMNSLYVKLFGRSVTWKKGHGRLRWLMAHPSAA